MRFSPHGYYAIWDVSVADPLATETKLDLPRALLDAAPCCLQLRGKDIADRDLCTLAEAVRPLCRKADVPFCMNDRVDLALAVGADVVHIGQDDLPIDAVRSVLSQTGQSMAIGVSTHNLEQAQSAADAGPDYLAFGPVFPTRSKHNPDPTVGIDNLAAVVSLTKLPVVAIGGITLKTVTEVVTSGASAAAVIAAVNTAENPIQAGRAIAAAFI